MLRNVHLQTDATQSLDNNFIDTFRRKISVHESGQTLFCKAATVRLSEGLHSLFDLIGYFGAFLTIATVEFSQLPDMCLQRCRDGKAETIDRRFRKSARILAFAPPKI